jgi:hypothetical protein
MYDRLTDEHVLEVARCVGVDPAEFGFEVPPQDAGEASGPSRISAVFPEDKVFTVPR